MSSTRDREALPNRFSWRARARFSATERLASQWMRRALGAVREQENQFRVGGDTDGDRRDSITLWPKKRRCGEYSSDWVPSWMSERSGSGPRPRLKPTDGVACRW